MYLFRDRPEAGRRLAPLLLRFRGPRTVVLGLAPGGLELADPIAVELGAPLDVWVTVPIRPPRRPEQIVGAIAEGQGLFIDHARQRAAELREAELMVIVEREAAELERRVRLYRGDHPRPELIGATVIVVEDGLCTGASAHAAARAIAHHDPKHLILAAGIASSPAVAALKEDYDEVLSVYETPDLPAVAAWYVDYPPLDPPAVAALLERARHRSFRLRGDA